jgi:zinc and cadmium transporter
LAVTVGIIAHEIPREMGDVAILLKSHFNERETVISNGLVNMISLVGVYLGLNSQGLSSVTRQYMLVFVCGNFLYIASDIWRNLFRHSNPLVNLLEGVGLIYGVFITLGHDHHH